MSMPVALDRYYTREEVLAFPDDGNRYELVHGELLVSPSPRTRHQRVVFRLARKLADWIEHHALGEVLMAPADISWGGLLDMLVQPDVFVIPPPERVREWIDVRDLSLVVEVLSPTTARYDRFTNRRLYQEMKVPLYWLVDPEHARAEVWTPDATFPVIEDHELTWHPVGAGSDFAVTLPELCRD